MRDLLEEETQVQNHVQSPSHARSRARACYQDYTQEQDCQQVHHPIYPGQRAHSGVQHCHPFADLQSLDQVNLPRRANHPQIQIQTLLRTYCRHHPCFNRLEAHPRHQANPSRSLNHPRGQVSLPHRANHPQARIQTLLRSYCPHRLCSNRREAHPRHQANLLRSPKHPRDQVNPPHSPNRLRLQTLTLSQAYIPHRPPFFHRKGLRSLEVPRSPKHPRDQVNLLRSPNRPRLQTLTLSQAYIPHRPSFFHRRGVRSLEVPGHLHERRAFSGILQESRPHHHHLLHRLPHHLHRQLHRHLPSQLHLQISSLKLPQYLHTTR